jgi:cytochrome P450
VLTAYKNLHKALLHYFSVAPLLPFMFPMLFSNRYETTANALSFTIYLLSNNKAKEAKMLEEIDRFGRDRKPTYADLESFPYVDAVLKVPPP